MVFLSATLPNSVEFAEWVCSIHHDPCHVVSTDFRPTPLAHYGYPLGNDKLFLVCYLMPIILLFLNNMMHMVCIMKNFCCCMVMIKYYFIKQQSSNTPYTLHYAIITNIFFNTFRCCTMQLVDEKGRFKTENFKLMKAFLSDEDNSASTTDASVDKNRVDAAAQQGRGKKDKNKESKKKEPSLQTKKTIAPDISNEIKKIISSIQSMQLDPVIIFSFSRRECEMYAAMLAGKAQRGKAADPSLAALDFNNAEEKAAVSEIFNSAIECLSEDDRKLPFIQSMLPMLQRGVGVHHSGLLPVLKELVEILFQEQLIKVRE